MDRSDEEPPLKRRRVEDLKALIKKTMNLPIELRNSILGLAMLSHLSDKTICDYEMMNTEGERITIRKSLHRVNMISDHGNYFEQPLTRMKFSAEPALHLTMPQVLFEIESYKTLEMFVGYFHRYTYELKHKPKGCIEFNILNDFCNESGFTTWTMRDDEHGKRWNVYENVEQSLQRLAYLPKEIHIVLRFGCFWYDYRSLRALSKRYGLHEREVGCHIESTCASLNTDPEFHVGLTISAVTGVDDPTRVELSERRRIELVNHGCRGFNVPRPPESVKLS